MRIQQVDTSRPDRPAARVAACGVVVRPARVLHRSLLIPTSRRLAATPCYAKANRSDGGGPIPEASSLFEDDSTQVVIRCLTARAVQKVLLSLQEVDGWAARWLNTFCATHPPLDGDKFISELMLEAPAALVDPYSGQTHMVNPTQLASGVLAVRKELAGHVAKQLPGAVQAGSVGVLRRHLEEHTYVSGNAGNDAPRTSYRNNRRQQRTGSKWQEAAN